MEINWTSDTINSWLNEGATFPLSDNVKSIEFQNCRFSLNEKKTTTFNSLKKRDCIDIADCKPKFVRPTTCTQEKWRYLIGCRSTVFKQY